VIVAYQNQIVMEPTLEGGLARLFGAAGAPPPPAAATGEGAPAATAPAGPTEMPSAPAAPIGLIAEAQAAYERAIAAQKAGDWAKYGEEIRRLGEILAKMRQ
jgi:uncharacterized membrane protein (UPF0182 family)